MKFECPRCETPVDIYTGGWSSLRDSNGSYPVQRVYEWIGQRLFTAMAAHMRECPQAEPGDDGRPILRLVVS